MHKSILVCFVIYTVGLSNDTTDPHVGSLTSEVVIKIKEVLRVVKCKGDRGRKGGRGEVVHVLCVYLRVYTLARFWENLT